jgi:aminodeoxyfutalosine deaminase
MSQRLVLFAKTILTMDRPRPIEDGFVLIQGGRILQVGKRKDLYFRPSMRLLDLGDTLLLPGLINAHCHLDFTSFKGRVRYAGSFREWLGKMAVATRATTSAEFKRSIQKGIKESLAYGTTTLCDISTSWESLPLLRESGLRSYVFLELLDLGLPSTRDYWRKFLDRLKALGREAPATPLFQWGLSPHTPFTVSKELFQLVRLYLQERKDLLTTIHVGESREEASYFRNGTGAVAKRVKELNPDRMIPRKTTPVQYLKDCGWLPKLDLGVHLNVTARKDIKLLAKNRIAVVHCPGSHAYFQHPPFPYRRMRRQGVKVCLGTDSLASNRSLSLFREMRLFKKAHPGSTAHEILSMATLGPARALGLGRELGQIKPGFLADLIGIPLSARKGPGALDPYQQVLSHRGTVTFSMVHGEPKMRLSPGK